MLKKTRVAGSATCTSERSRPHLAVDQTVAEVIQPESRPTRLKSALGAIVDKNAILPKLFRRLAEYMVHFGTATGFKEKMEQSAEPVLDLRSANFTHFDTFIEQEPGSVNIRLTRQPEELVFDEMVARPSNAFSLLMETDLEGRNDRRRLPVTEEIAET